MPCVFLLVWTINLLIGGVCWRTQIDKYIETHPNIQTGMKTCVNKHESLQKLKAASVIFSFCCKHISVFHICVYLCVRVCTSKPRLFWDELLPLPLKQLAGNRMRVIEISFFCRTNEVFFCLLVNMLTLDTSMRSVWRVGSWGGAKGRCQAFRPVVAPLPRRSLQRHAARFSGSLHQALRVFSGHVFQSSSDWVYHISPHGEFRRCKDAEEHSLWNDYIMLHHLLYWTL